MTTLLIVTSPDCDGSLDPRGLKALLVLTTSSWDIGLLDREALTTSTLLGGLAQAFTSMRLELGLVNTAAPHVLLMHILVAIVGLVPLADGAAQQLQAHLHRLIQCPCHCLRAEVVAWGRPHGSVVDGPRHLTR